MPPRLGTSGRKTGRFYVAIYVEMLYRDGFGNARWKWKKGMCCHMPFVVANRSLSGRRDYLPPEAPPASPEDASILVRASRFSEADVLLSGFGPSLNAISSSLRPRSFR